MLQVSNFIVMQKNSAGADHVMCFFFKDCIQVMYRTEENFGSKKLWRMNLTAKLAKKNFDEWTLHAADLAEKKLANWTEFAEKNCSANASVHQRSTRWRRGIHVQYK